MTETTCVHMYHPKIGNTFRECDWHNSWERIICDIKEGLMIKYGPNFNDELLEITLRPAQWESFKREIEPNLKYHSATENVSCFFMGIKISEVS